MTLEEKLKNLTDQPGVYQLLNDHDEIIYVGKAKNLKNRVRQYFQAESSQTQKVRAMMKHVKDINTIVTDTEVEALILECNLIKESRPKYNILLRDDKSYPYIKITSKERFPRVLKTRNMIKDGSHYFGPYTDAGAVNETLELIRTMYPLRNCNKKIDQGTGKIQRPCLNFHLRKCLGPCKGDVHHEDYLEMIRQTNMLLQGKETDLQDQLQQRMKAASERLEYEQAAMIRDQLAALSKITTKQKMDSGKEQDLDVIASSVGDREIFVQVFKVRGGKIIQQHHHVMKTAGYADEKQIHASFLKQFYGHTTSIPREILLAGEVEDRETIEAWLTDIKGMKVTIKIPRRGGNRTMVELAKRNADIQLQQRERLKSSEEERNIRQLEALKDLLGLAHIPYRIESIDISHTAGVDAVGALTVFEKGKALKKEYRKYRIRSAQGADDTGSIRELFTRRMHRTKMQDKGVMPDLYMIDGGQAQVIEVEAVLAREQSQVPVAGMIKDNKHRTRWLLYKGKRHDLKHTPGLWRLITVIQDETHRFAVSYHQQRRKKNMLHSGLLDIPGIGEVRRQHLLAHFRTMDKLKAATWQEIKGVPGFSEQLAKDVVYYFNKRQDEK